MREKALYGLIGYPLEHSFSQRYFSDKFRVEDVDAQYCNFPLENISEFPGFLAARNDLKGFNVTAPYKQAIIPYLDGLNDTAAQIGAVNCVIVAADGGLTGYNTDAPAFRESLLRLIGIERPSALLLGTGGAAKAAAYELKKLGIDFTYVSRRDGQRCINYGQLTPEIINSNRLIINATPLGMAPEVGSLPPIPYDALTAEHFMFDMVYNPSRTEFLRMGEVRGAKTMNGYEMLVGQAELSWDIWKNNSN